MARLVAGTAGLEVGRQQREVLQGRARRRSGRASPRTAPPSSANNPAASGDSGAEQVEEGAVGRQCGDLLLGLGEVVGVEAAEQPPVDQHQPVEVLVAGTAVEVPGGVGDGQRGAERVTSEDHSLRPRPPSRASFTTRRASSSATFIPHSRVKPPSCRRVDEVGAGRRRAADPAEVVVEDLLRRALAGEALLEDRRVLERVGAAVDRPDLEAPP